MRCIDLFAGIGGFALAARWMGWETLAWCEWNEFGQRVLKYHFPEAEGFGDITKTDFTKYANRIDILTGGFPCQPYSLAGKRKGKEDERHLWPQMLRAIREIQPRWVVGENVLGLVNWSGGLVFHEVQADLEAEGYEVFPYVLPACAVNAPHRRDRVWFVAYSREFEWIKYAINSLSTNSGSEQLQMRTQERNSEDTTEERTRLDNRAERSGNFRDASNPNSGRQPGKEYRQTEPGWIAEKSLSTDWQNFPTQSPVCDGNDGIPSQLDAITFPKWRNESIKAGGNAIVPNVAYQIFKAIEAMEKQYTSNQLAA